MFPVDYEEAFFTRVVNYQDGLESLTAVSRRASEAFVYHSTLLL